MQFQKKRKWLLLITFLIAASILNGCEIAVLNPQGPVARLQLDLIMYSVWFMLVIIIVVFGLFGYMIYKYRERPDNMDYEPPEQHGNTLLEIIWTAIPIIIIIAIAIPTIKSIYQLEEIPEGYKEVKPLTINVTSAEWKWIFSYPEQNIETVNYVIIPEDTPIKFQLTSTGTMASFWVPELGGQKYTMPNHSMELILLAENEGTFAGRNANFNGGEFTHMDFDVTSKSSKDFEEWVKEVKNREMNLTKDEYKKLLKPGLVGTHTYNGTHLKWTELNSIVNPGKTVETHSEHHKEDDKNDDSTSHQH